MHAHTCERGAREVLVHARALVNAEPKRSMPVRGSPTGVVLRGDGPRVYFCSRNQGSRPLSLLGLSWDSRLGSLPPCKLGKRRPCGGAGSPGASPVRDSENPLSQWLGPSRATARASGGRLPP